MLLLSEFTFFLPSGLVPNREYYDFNRWSIGLMQLDSLEAGSGGYRPPMLLKYYFDFGLLGMIAISILISFYGFYLFVKMNTCAIAENKSMLYGSMFPLVLCWGGYAFPLFVAVASIDLTVNKIRLKG